MGDDRVRAYAEEEGLPVLMEIPFDRSIAEAYSRGQALVEAMPEWKAKFLALEQDIGAIVNGQGRRTP
jgi:MinD superfamily P-loop ATPase